MDPMKLKAVQDWPKPKKVKDIQQFLGFCNFYRHIVQDYSTLARPLFDLTKKDMPWAWTHLQETVFTALQHALTSAPVLILLDYNKPFTLITDASDYATGSILEQDNALGRSHPVAFYSKSPNATTKFMTKNSWLLFMLSSISDITSKAVPTRQRSFRTTQISSTLPRNKRSHIAKRSGPYSLALLTMLSSPSLANLTRQMCCPGVQIIKRG